MHRFSVSNATAAADRPRLLAHPLDKTAASGNNLRPQTFDLDANTAVRSATEHVCVVILARLAPGSQVGFGIHLLAEGRI
jgi:hypothetical protein